DNATQARRDQHQEVGPRCAAPRKETMSNEKELALWLVTAVGAVPTDKRRARWAWRYVVIATSDEQAVERARAEHDPDPVLDDFPDVGLTDEQKKVFLERARAKHAARKEQKTWSAKRWTSLSVTLGPI